VVYIDIFLSDKAFIGIILSAIEVYKYECLGALLGYNLRNRIVVEYAIPYQTAKRKPSQVEPNWRRETQVQEILPQLLQLQHIGYFHSHTQRGEQEATSRPSNQDIKSMIPGQIEIIVAVNDAKKRLVWNRSKEGGLYGTIGNYRIKIAAFYKRKKDQEIMRYPIMCPYVLGFDLTFQE